MKGLAALAAIVGALVFAGTALAVSVTFGTPTIDQHTRIVSVPVTYQCDAGATTLDVEAALIQGFNPKYHDDYRLADEESLVVACTAEPTTTVMTFPGGAPTNPFRPGQAYFQSAFFQDGVWFPGTYGDVKITPS